jgi:hypothetical protein
MYHATIKCAASEREAERLSSSCRAFEAEAGKVVGMGVGKVGDLLCVY